MVTAASTLSFGTFLGRIASSKQACMKRIKSQTIAAMIAGTERSHKIAQEQKKAYVTHTTP